MILRLLFLRKRGWGSFRRRSSSLSETMQCKNEEVTMHEVSRADVVRCGRARRGKGCPSWFCCKNVEQREKSLSHFFYLITFQSEYDPNTLFERKIYSKSVCSRCHWTPSMNHHELLLCSLCLPILCGLGKASLIPSEYPEQ